MTDIKTVTTQDELDEALAAGIIDLLIDRPDDATPLDIENKKVRLWGNSSANLWDNSSAILRDNSSAILRENSSAVLWGNSSADLWDNSRADLWDNSRADLWCNSSADLRGNSSANLRGNSSADLWDNSRADLWDNSSADLWDNSRADLRGNSSADLRDNSRADLKKFTVAWKKSVDVTITGTGHVIDMSALDLSNPGEWAEYVGVNVDEEGQVHLFKAVDDNLESVFSRGKFLYEIGSIVQPEKWSKNNRCGNGIHLSPSPQHARDHFPRATRFLEVTCDVATFMPIDASKIKAPEAFVLREVDINGDPLKEDK